MDKGFLIAYLKECAETEKEWHDIKLRKQQWGDANIFSLRRDIVRELLKLVEQSPNVEQNSLETRIMLLEKELEIRQLKFELEVEKHKIKEKIVHVYQSQTTGYPYNPWGAGTANAGWIGGTTGTYDAKGATGSCSVTSPMTSTETNGTGKV